MDPKQRKIFEAYFQLRVEREDAFATGDKLALVQRMYQEAVEEGVVPIAANRVAKVRTDTPRVQAILAGKEVAIGGEQIQSASTFQQRLANLPLPVKLAIIALLFLGIVGGSFLVLNNSSGEPEITPTITETATITLTATNTTTSGPVQPSATPYDVVLDSAGAPEGPHDPVSVAFGSIAFSLKQAKLEGGEWQPAVAEWLPGTELRRVVAVPYSQEVGDAVGKLTFGDAIILRLRSGEVVKYNLVDVQRVQRYEIEIMNSLRPSLVVILHSERSGQRWALVADVVQGENLPEQTATPTPTMDLTAANLTPTQTLTPTHTATPTHTPTPTSTAAPAFAFTPPAPVTEVFTETLTIENPEAGLQLQVSNCSEVTQIGATQGDFVVCNVTLTALKNNASYSGDTLAVTERAQVEQVPGWWPPPLSVIGAIGSGGLAKTGDMVSGRVAGEVSKNQSEPVLLWEQDGLRFVVILAEALE